MPASTKPQQAQSAKWYSIRAQARVAASATPPSAEILIYGDIGESWYGDTIAASNFVRELAALDVDLITVRINSYGGSVTDGIAIFNALKRHSATVTTVVDGVAASISSLIAMSGDSIEMAENALMMIHAPWLSYVSGNSVDLREFADMLDTYADAMATSYASRSGDKVAALALLTDGKDHWYTAEEALTAKLIDAVVAGLPVAASAQLRGAAQARFASFPQQSAAPVPVPATQAKATHSIPKENTPMPAPNPSPDAAASAEQIRAEALRADQERRSAIVTACAGFASTEGVVALRDACAADINCTVEQANAKLLAHLAQGAAPIAGTRIVTLEDERDKFRAGALASIMARSSLDKDDRANQYRGYSLMDVARECLARGGVKAHGMDKMALVAAAFTHTGSDFPLLLANVAEKAMMKGYEEAQETFQLWTVEGTLGDFKPGKRVDLNTFPALSKIEDGGEYTNATIGERGETVQLATYGKKFSITRQGIINDDLDAFAKIPRRMGRAAIRTIGDLVYAILTGNPVMSDNVALFHATHSNLLAAGAISTTSVDAMRVAMATQKDGKAALNIRLSKLLVPVALEGAASVVRDSEFEVGAASRNNTTPNSVRKTFEVISDARLDAVSATNWYGVADQAVNDTVEVSYLDGVKTPTLEQQNGWDIDGVEFKVRMDAGVKALDFRTMAKNPN